MKPGTQFNLLVTLKEVQLFQECGSEIGPYVRIILCYSSFQSSFDLLGQLDIYMVTTVYDYEEFFVRVQTASTGP
jgi:hypothetical protein